MVVVGEWALARLKFGKMLMRSEVESGLGERTVYIGWETLASQSPLSLLAGTDSRLFTDCLVTMVKSTQIARLDGSLPRLFFLEFTDFGRVSRPHARGLSR